MAQNIKTINQTREERQLPLPEAAAIQHSEKLIQYIKTAIQAKHGKISFAEYMDLILYAPNLGYYQAGVNKIGKSGDFITAPEISPLFSQCIANQCRQILAELDSPIILELGAGNGTMASEILIYLEQNNCLPDEYQILELSAELKDKQTQTIQAKCPELANRVTWLNKLPATPINGVILANEVMDAMPVNIFELQDDAVYERYVTWENNKFAWQLAASEDEIFLKQVNSIKNNYLTNISGCYFSEINLRLQPWIAELNSCLERGAILLIDYGYPNQEYYHPARSQGTLMCHYRHNSHPDPFVYPGLQDLTAHVDFSQVANAMDGVGLNLAGFTNQASFLLNCGLLDLLSNNLNPADQYEINQQIKYLTLPSEMGEIIKVIAGSKNLDFALCGFQQFDQRHRL